LKAHYPAEKPSACEKMNSPDAKTLSCILNQELEIVMNMLNRKGMATPFNIKPPNKAKAPPT